MRFKIDLLIAPQDEDLLDGMSERLQLAEGLTVKLRKGPPMSGFWGMSASFIVDKAADVGVGVAVAALTKLIYRFKGARARITIDKTEIQYNDKGKIAKVIRERLTKR
jgi:hypothetical protein